MKKILFIFSCVSFTLATISQETYPVNGLSDKRTTTYAFTHATIFKDHVTILQNATMIIREDKIISVGNDINIPKNAVVIDCSGKFIYPSFIDIYSNYGLPAPKKPIPFNFRSPIEFNSKTKGSASWNEAMKPEVAAATLFSVNDTTAMPLRNLGFGTVLIHQKDGIARGTGTIVTLANKKENAVVLKGRASAHYSLSKGSSSQTYPGSLMGVIALLRQTYLDGQWYKQSQKGEGVNVSLEQWNNNQSLPQIMEAGDKWNDIRADRVGDEFGVQYIIKGGGNEYQRIKAISATKASFILPVDFPLPMDLSDPNDAMMVGLSDLKHWELAPTNPAALEKAGISFCITTSDLKEVKDFSVNLQKAIRYGLSEQKALDALTRTPATLLGIYQHTGSIEAGKLANFIVSTGPVFREKSAIVENWIQGEKYEVNIATAGPRKGLYTILVQSPSQQSTFTLNVLSASTASIITADTFPVRFSYTGKIVTLSFSPFKEGKNNFILGGIADANYWSGNGQDTLGQPVTWSSTFMHATDKVTDTTSLNDTILATITYPFNGYGWDSLPVAHDLLIINTTILTNEKVGILSHSDLLIRQGKIAQIGKGLKEAGATVIDGTGLYLTPGIIDEHSHIATTSINEYGQSISSEVRIADNLNPEDINIYRQLSGGVTSSHILHGSANTIGGQTQLIKLRWGADDNGLKFSGADSFIKFALGENVKKTYSTANNRFPDTRMGVEALLNDAFSRATAYSNALKSSDNKNVRRDLELEALVEVMNKKRFITFHSYVQSELTAAMRVAEKFGFTINTFTHVLEGYKVADKIKAHGATASTFSDWWAYKTEVQDAIAYNASIMQKMGINVCINSDDPEMARRLNQEAAKTVKYGGTSEADAFKMITINPAKALHIQERVGSIQVGKDADLVLWTDDPLSIYAKVDKTIVDGIVYFDLSRDLLLRKHIRTERYRLIQKMLEEKRLGKPTRAPEATVQPKLNCEEQ
jgi:imidazolonepropionase-like amidohydrolase